MAKGNPTQLGSRAKFETAVDWVAPSEPRFEIKRFYTSTYDIRSNALTAHFGNYWSLEYAAETISNESLGAYNYNRADGSLFSFLAVDGKSRFEVPEFGGYPFAGGRLVTAPEGTFNALIEKNGLERWFSRTRPASYKWPDGYEINFSFGSQWMMWDNRGNWARIVYSNVQFSSQSRALITAIEIDTNNTSARDFSPIIRINYEYAENPGNTGDAPLTRVTRTDLTTGVTEIIAEYEYKKNDDNSDFIDPLLLTEIRDGRTYDDGTTFPYAIFDYEAADLDAGPYAELEHGAVFNNWPVVSTSHFGGADGYTFTATSATNALGHTTNYVFGESEGRQVITGVEGLATPNCQATAKGYDYTPPTSDQPRGYVYSRVERNGSLTTFTRDAQGRILTKTEDTGGPDERITSYTWHPVYHKPLTRVTQGLSEAFTYTDRGLLLSYSQTDTLPGSPNLGETRTWTYTYEARPTTTAYDINVLTAVDGPGRIEDGVNDVTTYAYDDLERLIRITDANGLTTEILGFDDLNLPTLIRNPDGIEWGFSYDIMGRVTQMVLNPNGASPQTSTFTYDVIGQLTSSTDMLGRTWTYDYSEARRLTRITSPSGEQIRYTHDLMGNVTGTEYANGANPATFFETAQFDELGRILKTIGAEGQVWDFRHDVEDNLDQITDPLAHTISNSFDALNRLKETIDQAGYTTATEHDDDDQLTKFTDPRNIETVFDYNGFGELVREISADRGTMLYSYNHRGLVTEMIDGNGQVSTYEYDNGGRLIARRFLSDSRLDQTFTYDTAPNGTGKIARTTDSSGYTDRTYAAQTGFIASETRNIEGTDYTLGYDFNVEGELGQITYPSGTQVQITRDTESRITDIAVTPNGTGSPMSVLTGAQYLPMGPLTSATFGDGGQYQASFDKSYRLRTITDTVAGTQLRNLRYAWTKRDNLAAVVDNLDSTSTERFRYTARERLSGAGGAYGDIGYFYDGTGNRIRRTELVDGVYASEAYLYPQTNNLLQQVNEKTGHARTFTYDAAGNVIYDNRSGGGYGFTYDAANRMASMSVNGVVQAEYLYNAAGQQVVRRLTQEGRTIHSVHDLDGQRIAEYEVDPVAGTSSLLREYVWMDMTPVAVIENGQVYFIRADHIGRPIFATDGNGTKVWQATYLPFGGVHTTSGDTIALRFPGQWFQSESGLHQNWMRDYDPTTGRYIQGDPLGLVDGASVYGYALQNPGRYIDPTGEAIPLMFWAGAAAGLAYAAWKNYQRYGTNFACYNYWQIAGYTAMGAATGWMGGPALFSAAGRTGIGASAKVNGLVGAAWSSRMSSMAYNAVSRRLRAANGLIGKGSSITLHHWAIAQGGRIGTSRFGQSRLGQAIINSRWNLNPINGALNSSIGKNIYNPRNFWRGAPNWAKFGPIFGGGGFSMTFGSGGTACECGN
ncbi:RHS repeat domain-containing protein [Pseudaestuariivita rosea]|uniref:RHS repeat domain-containing protein n=1 Tax=Pseudaestuariivita rosea TaxID=2763263 RepID=UPI001ABAEA50|nr:RHS repeat domain-containing protein [Pseudaestuariivita rosea]